MATVEGIQKGAFALSPRIAEVWGEEATHAEGVGSRRIPTRGTHIVVRQSVQVLHQLPSAISCHILAFRGE